MPMVVLLSGKLVKDNFNTIWHQYYDSKSWSKSSFRLKLILRVKILCWNELIYFPKIFILISNNRPSSVIPILIEQKQKKSANLNL